MPCLLNRLAQRRTQRYGIDAGSIGQPESQPNARQTELSDAGTGKQSRRRRMRGKQTGRQRTEEPTPSSVLATRGPDHFAEVLQAVDQFDGDRVVQLWLQLAGRQCRGVKLAGRQYIARANASLAGMYRRCENAAATLRQSIPRFRSGGTPAHTGRPSNEEQDIEEIMRSFEDIQEQPVRQGRPTRLRNKLLPRNGAHKRQPKNQPGPSKPDRLPPSTPTQTSARESDSQMTPDATNPTEPDTEPTWPDTNTHLVADLIVPPLVTRECHPDEYGKSSSLSKTRLGETGPLTYATQTAHTSPDDSPVHGSRQILEDFLRTFDYQQWQDIQRNRNSAREPLDRMGLSPRNITTN